MNTNRDWPPCQALQRTRPRVLVTIHAFHGRPGWNHCRARLAAGKLAIVGFLTTLLGLVVMLAGNAIEFWVASSPGGFMFLFGLLVQPIGLILLGFPFSRRTYCPVGAGPSRSVSARFWD